MRRVRHERRAAARRARAALQSRERHVHGHARRGDAHGGGLSGPAQLFVQEALGGAVLGLVLGWLAGWLADIPRNAPHRRLFA